MKLRILCTETDFGLAANVGGPVNVNHKTFDLPCSPELEAWLADVDKWRARTIHGVEKLLLTTEPTNT